VSSNVFSIELQTDPVLRCTVLLTGALATILGIMMILTLPMNLAMALAASLLWSVISMRELLLMCKAYSRYRRLRLDSAGKVALISDSGDSQAATLLAGSVVLGRLAWLRIESSDGLRFAELMCGNGRENKQWRLLQVIWRHFGAAS